MFPQLLDVGTLPGFREDMTPQECLERVGTGAWPVIRWPDVEKPVSEKNVKEHAPEPLEKGNESTE